MRHETFVTPLIHGIMEEDWIDAFWVLFDCLWAVECAVIQRHVDLRRQAGVLGSSEISPDTDETLEQLWHSRTSLIISIFHITGPMEPTPALLDALAITLLEWNDDIDSFLSRQDSLTVSIFFFDLVSYNECMLSKDNTVSPNAKMVLKRKPTVMRWEGIRSGPCRRRMKLTRRSKEFYQHDQHQLGTTATARTFQR